MTELDSIRQTMADFLKTKGIVALCAWPETRRAVDTRPLVAVSVRQCRGGPAGFWNYLGERYNAERGQWEELYGKRMELTLGLDIYAPAAAGAARVEKMFYILLEVLEEGPEGIQIQTLTCGETTFDKHAGLYRCGVEAQCQAWLCAIADEAGIFLDFEVKGRGKH